MPKNETEVKWPAKQKEKLCLFLSLVSGHRPQGMKNLHRKEEKTSALKEKSSDGWNHVGIRLNSLLLIGVMCLFRKTPYGSSRGKEDSETNLPCSCARDGSRCCSLTVVSSPGGDKK